MKTINLHLYSFDELDKAAKEKALTKYRHLNVDFDWWDNEYEDFIEICSYLGVTVDKESIRFSGFYSQGDGSGFSGTVDILKLVEAIKGEAWKAYAPLLEFLFPTLDVDRKVMALVANGILPNEPQIISRTRQYGVAVDLAISVVNENGRMHDHVFDELDKLEEWVRVVAEKLNYYLYHALEKQYEFLTSDNALVDTILVNEYLFTADGRSANHLTQLTQHKS
jgi:hypothetical protein